MEALPWIAAVVIAIILGVTVVAAVGAKNGIKAEVKKAEIEANTAYATAVREHNQTLKNIETRLAAIEKTLSDIP
jgi:uncharacterized protein HemX